MRAILSLSSAELTVQLNDADGEFIKDTKLDDMIQAERDKSEKKTDDTDSEEEANDQVDGGKVNLRRYNENKKSQTLEARLIDPLDGGEPNYRPRGTRTNIKDSVRIKPVSHNPRNSHER